MRTDNGRTESAWMATADLPDYPPLQEHLSVDVCVVGSGIAGMTTAYLLAQLGKRVAVLDDGPLAGGETARTTAHLSNAFDDRYFELEKMVGADGSRIAAESHTAAISRIESIVRDEAIDCEFKRLDGYLFLVPGDETSILEKELEAARNAGLADVELVKRAPVDFFDSGPCLRFPRQAMFHPLRYIAGLARAIERLGGSIYCGTRVEEIEGGSPAAVRTTAQFSVTAKSVVVATNSPITERLAIHTKMAPYRTFVIGARVPAGSIPPVLLWDTGDPYHYVRTMHGNGAGFDLLIVGGEDHKTGQEDDAEARFERLEAWTRDRFPMAGEIEMRWSGQVMEPQDYVAFIGESPEKGENVWIACGDSGQGMTHGTIAGILLSDLITGRENHWAELYDPKRISLRAATAFAKENLNVARQYLDWVTPDPAPEDTTIQPGTGAVINRNGKPIAAFRDESGTLHECSAVCVHLGCIVQWNSLEESWDCPCHGSRYDAYGKVVNGPAAGDLKPAE